MRHLAVGIGALLVLGVGCDSGSDDAEDSPVPKPSLDVVEACREVYERLPPATRDATTEEAFIEQCRSAVSGRPDPTVPPRTPTVPPRT
jgi:hypothetical protein